jgi:hypothetical protein
MQIYVALQQKLLGSQMNAGKKSHHRDATDGGLKGNTCNVLPAL